MEINGEKHQIHCRNCRGDNDDAQIGFYIDIDTFSTDTFTYNQDYTSCDRDCTFNVT